MGILSNTQNITYIHGVHVYKEWGNQKKVSSSEINILATLLILINSFYLTYLARSASCRSLGHTQRSIIIRMSLSDQMFTDSTFPTTRITIFLLY